MVRLLRQSKCHLKNFEDVKANYCSGDICAKYPECLHDRVNAYASVCAIMEGLEHSKKVERIKELIQLEIG